MSAPNKAARAAILALLDVDAGGFSNLVFKKRAAALSDSRDRAFAFRVFYGTLERRLTLDALLTPFLKKGIKGVDKEVRCVLETGLYRAIYLSGSPAAAISDSVELCRSLKKSSAAGLVNAVLRKASQNAEERIKELPIHERLSVCPELWAQLQEDFGSDAEAVVQGFFSESPDIIRVNTLKTTEDELLAALKDSGIKAEKSPLENALLVSGGYIGTEAFEKGEFHVIGLPAQLSALSLSAKSGMRVLDMCAAPGGKTMTIAQEMENKGEIVALDRSANRLSLLEKNAERLGVTCIRTEARDASADLSDLGEFDRVLCDAPCSGYGEIGKKPEIRYHDPKAFESLPELQLKLLSQGAKRVKVGGRLTYSTCTILHRENREVAKAFLASHPEFSPVKLQIPDGIIPYSDDFSLFLPVDGLGEGFYIATFERMC